VLALIERAPLDPDRIEWAWDIAGRDAQRAREVRVLASCVPMLQRGQRKSFEAVMQEIFTDVLVRENFRRYSTVSVTFLARRLACSDRHMLDLLYEGELRAVPASLHRVGRNSSPAITWDSVKSFLERRRLQ
jgi:hypothetical protein